MQVIAKACGRAAAGLKQEGVKTLVLFLKQRGMNVGLKVSEGRREGCQKEEAAHGHTKKSSEAK